VRPHRGQCESTSSVAAFSAFIALLTDVTAACSFVSRSTLPLGPTWLPRSCEIDTSGRWGLPVNEWSMCDYNSECRPSLTEDGKIIWFAVGRVNVPARDTRFDPADATSSSHFRPTQ
jgi:hypothetical protein